MSSMEKRSGEKSQLFVFCGLYIPIFILVSIAIMQVYFVGALLGWKFFTVFLGGHAWIVYTQVIITILLVCIWLIFLMMNARDYDQFIKKLLERKNITMDQLDFYRKISIVIFIIVYLSAPFISRL